MSRAAQPAPGARRHPARRRRGVGHRPAAGIRHRRPHRPGSQLRGLERHRPDHPRSQLGHRRPHHDHHPRHPARRPRSRCSSPTAPPSVASGGKTSDALKALTYNVLSPTDTTKALETSSIQYDTGFDAGGQGHRHHPRAAPHRRGAAELAAGRRRQGRQRDRPARRRRRPDARRPPPASSRRQPPPVQPPGLAASSFSGGSRRVSDLTSTDDVPVTGKALSPGPVRVSW